MSKDPNDNITIFKIIGMVISLIFQIIFAIFKGILYTISNVIKAIGSSSKKIDGDAEDEIVIEEDEVEYVVPGEPNKKRKAWPWSKEQQAGPPKPEGVGATEEASKSDADKDDANAYEADEAFTRKQATYVHLDIDNGTDSAQIVEVLKAYITDPVLGGYAGSSVDALRSSEYERTGYFAELNSRFEQGSITWVKFSAPVELACDTILRNSATLGNLIQSFDTNLYQRLCTAEHRGVLANDQTRTQRLLLLKQKLNEIKSIEAGNEQLLLDVERLTYELSHLSGSSSSKSDELIEELETLTEQLKYYRD